MRLLLDLGNTRLKWSARDATGEVAHGAVAWSEPVAERLLAAWQILPPVQAAFGSGAFVLRQ